MVINSRGMELDKGHKIMWSNQNFQTLSKNLFYIGLQSRPILHILMLCIRHASASLSTLFDKALNILALASTTSSVC